MTNFTCEVFVSPYRGSVRDHIKLGGAWESEQRHGGRALQGNRMSKWTAEIDCNLLQKGETSVATIPNNDAADVIGDAVRLLFQNFENYSTDLTCANVINLGVLI